MSIETFNRKEVSFALTNQAARILTREIDQRLTSMPGWVIFPPIRMATMYYDTPAQELYRAGVERGDVQRQVRLRSYTGRFDADCYLELKQQTHDRTEKWRTRVPASSVPSLLGVPPRIDHESENEVRTRFSDLVAELLLRPVMWMSYTRSAFEMRNSDGLLRVTVDKDITAWRFEELLGANFDLAPDVLVSLGILEVKGRGALPDWLSEIVLAADLQLLPGFSKFLRVTSELYASP